MISHMYPSGSFSSFFLFNSTNEIQSQIAVPDHSEPNYQKSMDNRNYETIKSNLWLLVLHCLTLLKRQLLIVRKIVWPSGKQIKMKFYSSVFGKRNSSAREPYLCQFESAIKSRSSNSSVKLCAEAVILCTRVFLIGFGHISIQS